MLLLRVDDVRRIGRTAYRVGERIAKFHGTQISIDISFVSVTRARMCEFGPLSDREGLIVLFFFFSGNERDGFETVAKHPGLVHHVLRGAVDRNDLHRLDSIGRENPTASGSSANIHFTLRLHFLDSDVLVSESLANFSRGHGETARNIRTRKYTSPVSGTINHDLRISIKF